MISRLELIQYLHNLLNCAQFKDYAPNGLQVEGKDQIKRICTAVTASEAVISEAVTQKADALIVHHGYFWRGEEAVITGIKRQRIAKLLNHNMNLFAYHLPLDCHLELGNNTHLGRLLSIESSVSHQVQGVDNLLWSGKLSKPMSGKQLTVYIQEKLKRAPLHLGDPHQLIHSIAWCTGAAQDYIDEAYHLGVDAYLSGEVSERTYYQAQELGIQYFACGHHATERYGIQALGSHLSNQFGLEHRFIDSDNPI
ncbi:Nif3-like dinuclear metal center hexameric protein [Legionella waltersii]|uniref:GTP cyclohydrolase 1 type 2 homolog n=1 Tax=Legionella waltersii TaxID=66969 RepID=A0A0W1ANB0_9GAMM|nr:Nif3-like dinuclear metal center hexameric protein [Legionella waltersii]KTD82836.1 putative NIF3-like protein 1 [Legionella waltersii]SNV01673.1 putative NIF3-like protein 1 [Legionella waltersii]